ncbi:hypothetical protein QW131_30520 [Roseibium salinum]|nr:hypothetical protein [Roseibium salinum]
MREHDEAMARPAGNGNVAIATAALQPDIAPSGETGAPDAQAGQNDAEPAQDATTRRDGQAENPAIAEFVETNEAIRSMIEVVEAEQSLLWVSSPASARNASAPKLRVVDGESAADAEDPAEQNRIVNLEAKAAPDARVDPARPVKDQPLPQIPPRVRTRVRISPHDPFARRMPGGRTGIGHRWRVGWPRWRRR